MACEEEITEASVIYGSDNVFADLGFEDADEMLAKAKLVVAIKDTLKARKPHPS